jgi:hypothetical protein
MVDIEAKALMKSLLLLTIVFTVIAAMGFPVSTRADVEIPPAGFSLATCVICCVCNNINH